MTDISYFPVQVKCMNDSCSCHSSLLFSWLFCFFK